MTSRVTTVPVEEPSRNSPGAAAHVAPAVDTRFLKSERPVVTLILRCLGHAYATLAAGPLRVSLPAWLTRDHLLFFLLAAAGMIVVNPRFLVLGQYAVERFLLSLDVPKPDLRTWPYVPSILIPLVGLALLTFFASPAVRLRALVVSSVPLGLLYGYLDLQSIPPFAALLLVAFAVIRSPLPRLAAAGAIVAIATAFLLVCQAWLPGTSVTRVASFQTAFLPLLWYSVYEHVPPRRRLRLGRFGLYMYSRFFGAPVVTYADVFTPVPGGRLAAIRFGGVKAIYVATFASIAGAAYDQTRRAWPIDEAAGLALLLVSYGDYVAYYCRIVVRLNLAIGVLRLFGVPIRDNFNYWLLARTPNEHWQRWNILLREWIITFVFFPIMRGRQWLFVAIMAALLASGVLHAMPAVVRDGWHTFSVVKSMGYWTINGLAIYLVVKAPRVFPRMVTRLRIGQRWEWSVVGVALTSAFYAVLHSLRACDSWTEMGDYLAALCEARAFSLH